MTVKRPSPSGSEWCDVIVAIPPSPTNRLAQAHRQRQVRRDALMLDNYPTIWTLDRPTINMVGQRSGRPLYRVSADQKASKEASALTESLKVVATRGHVAVGSL